MLTYVALGGGVLVLLAVGVLLVILAVAAGFLATGRKPRPRLPAVELSPMVAFTAPDPLPPGEALIGAFEVAGKRRAGALIEDQLGAAKAAEVVGSITRAFAPEAPSARPARGGG